MVSRAWIGMGYIPIIFFPQMDYHMNNPHQLLHFVETYKQIKIINEKSLYQCKFENNSLIELIENNQ